MLNPVFISDLATLKARLRLSSVDTGDAAALLDSVVEEVRVGLFHRLGSSLVTEIQAITITGDADTDDELRALRAQSLELNWVRALLMERMPMLFVPALGQARDAWNDEGVAREADPNHVRKEVAKLMRAVEESIAILTGDTAPGVIRATTIAPDETPPIPGESIAPPYLRTGS